MFIRKIMSQVQCATRIAAIQLQCTDNIEQNMTKITSLVKEAEKTGAKMAFLPESFDFIRSTPDQPYKLADFLTGSVVQQMQTLACDTNMWLFLGGYQTKFYSGDQVSDRLRNTHVVINCSGEIVTTYNKINMFDLVGVFKESADFDPGDTLTPPVETPAGNVGVQICYDLRFSEFALMLRKMGADIIVYSAAFTYETGRAHWEILVKTRAVETQCYVVAVNQTGWHNEKMRSFGNTMIVDPWGEVVARCGEEVGFIVADMDHALIKKVRDRMPCFTTHRLTNFYPNSTFWSPREINSNFVFELGDLSVTSNKLFLRTQFSVAFVNPSPAVPGHVIVCPLRRNVVKYGDLNFDELVDLNYCVQKIGQVLENRFKGNCMSIRVQNGVSNGILRMYVFPQMAESSDVMSTNLQNCANVENREMTAEELLEETLAWKKYFY